MSRHFRKHGHKDAAFSININSMVAKNQDEIVRRKLKQGVRIDESCAHTRDFSRGLAH